jgi:glycosyltransferase involved in cell wall biosynthesis
MPELTYVIPVYNGASFIERTLRSIIEQPGGRPKIIVVDDGSTDETVSVVSTYKSELTLLRQRNAGPSAARNFGLHAVDTEVVCFVDSDDYLIGPHRQSIEKSWNENVDMIIGLAAEGNDAYVTLSSRNKYDTDATNYTLLRDFLCDNVVQTSTICWSSMFLRKIGGWDEALFGPEDIELAMRAFLNDARVEISNTPAWVVWHRHSLQMSQNLGAKCLRIWRQEELALANLNRSRVVASQVLSHRKLIALIEKANGDRDILLLFFQRCMRLGRSLYLNGFRREAIEVMSIAWNRGHTEHNGPLLERVLANYLGTRVVLSARSFIGEIKRGGLRRRERPAR